MQYDILNKLGIGLDDVTGHLYYKQNFKPLPLSYELIFIRHGETYGNCGQSNAEGQIDHTLVALGKKNKDNRIFQGNTDTEINQLTTLGRKQADDLANQLENTLLASGFIPDIILYSPLKRAKETGYPFVKRNNFYDRYIEYEGIKEMSFGSWENRRICDLSPDNPCHLFYSDQNALVKESGINATGQYQIAENFCELLIRTFQVLYEIEKEYPEKRIILFSHSMFGAACSILFGHGQMIESGNYLAFDGKRTNGKSYAIPHTTPFYLNKVNRSKAKC